MLSLSVLFAGECEMTSAQQREENSDRTTDQFPYELL